MNYSLSVDGCAIVATAGRYKRPIVCLPTPKYANNALSWCHKKELTAGEAALALLDRAKTLGGKPFGKTIPPSFGRLAGQRALLVNLEMLTIAYK